jgi:hypothetical protein
VAFAAALGSLAAAYRYVVTDSDADLEGEAEGGSFDVEARNVMARTAVIEADAVLAVGSPSMKGLHALTRVLADVAGLGVPPARILPVLNGAPRSPRSRAVLTGAVAELTGALGDIRPPLFLPARDVDTAFRDGAPMPAPLPALVAAAVRAVVAVPEPASPSRRRGHERLRRVVPGTLGSWRSDEVAG